MPDMSDDEKYLRDLAYPEDTWVLSGQQWYAASEIADRLGLSDGGVRNLAERGVFPGAIQYAEKRIGWRIPRSGLIAFIAAQRRNTQSKRNDTTA
jgi:hypothetical protein